MEEWPVASQYRAGARALHDAASLVLLLHVVARAAPAVMMSGVVGREWEFSGSAWGAVERDLLYRNDDRSNPGPCPLVPAPVENFEMAWPALPRQERQQDDATTLRRYDASTIKVIRTRGQEENGGQPRNAEEPAAPEEADRPRGRRPGISGDLPEPPSVRCVRSTAGK